MEEEKIFYIMKDDGDEFVIEEKTILRAIVKALKMMKEDDAFFLIYEDNEIEPIEVSVKKVNDYCYRITMSWPYGQYLVCLDDESFAYMRIQ